jgi:uncharacterized phage protein gp47/JayE
MQLSLRNFTSIFNTAAAAVQGTASQLIDLSPGSTLGAILNANASLALWIQWLILQVLRTTRAATSTGADLDSWMADFALVRLPAVAAAGNVTFSRFVASTAAFLPVGATVRTSDGSQTFAVTVDTANAAWNATQNGYSLAPGVLSLTVPTVAQVPGAAGNIQAGAISLLAAAVPGIDTVTNAMPFLNGLDAESDAAFRRRFQDYIASRSRATKQAIAYAIESTQQALHYLIQENIAADGSQRFGSFLVVIDDGSGQPPSSLMAAVSAAIDAVRPIGSSFAIQPPVVIQANVTLAITLAPGASRSAIMGEVYGAIIGFIDALPIGAPLPWSRIAQLAYGADPAVTNVTGVLLNGSAADLSAGPTGVIKALSIVVN